MAGRVLGGNVLVVDAVLVWDDDSSTPWTNVPLNAPEQISQLALALHHIKKINTYICLPKNSIVCPNLLE